MTSQTGDTGRGEDKPQTCAECGTPSTPGQSFCDGCGAVLTWASAPGLGSGAADPEESTAPGGPRVSAGSAGSAGPAFPAVPAGTAASAGTASSAGSGGPPAEAAAPSAPTGSPSRPGPAAGAPAPAGAAAPADAAARTGPASATVAAGAASPAGPDRSAVSAAQDGPGATTGSAAPDGSAGAGAAPPAAHPTSGRKDAAARAALGDLDSDTGSAPTRSRSGLERASSAASAGGSTARPADGVPTVPLPEAAPAVPDTVPLPSPSADAAATERARALLVPVADAEQPPPAIAPVLPGRPEALRPTVQGPGGDPGDDGGTPCPWCGTGNRPDRHFCRRCAMTMAGRPEDPPKPAWWRRLPGLDPRRVPWAGERPRLRRDWSRITSRLLGAVVLALVAALALRTGPVVRTVRDHFAKRAPVSPENYSASHSYPQHGPSLAFDKHSNTWWGPGVTGSGAGQWIQAQFDQPVNLLDVIITPGESTQASDLSDSAIPQRLEADVTTADGKIHTTFLTLDQANSPQTRAFGFTGVSTVRFVIDSSYGASSGKQVAIAEIEFFGPSSGNGS